MDVHLIDGTYELFRHFYSVPAAQDVNDREIGAVRAVLRSVLSIIEHGATHIGVATDHVVESFRNELYAGYNPRATSGACRVKDRCKSLSMVGLGRFELPTHGLGNR
jgi:5'-3' exonuclease